MALLHHRSSPLLYFHWWIGEPPIVAAHLQSQFRVCGPEHGRSHAAMAMAVTSAQSVMLNSNETRYHGHRESATLERDKEFTTTQPPVKITWTARGWWLWKTNEERVSERQRPENGRIHELTKLKSWRTRNLSPIRNHQGRRGPSFHMEKHWILNNLANLPQ